MKQVARVFVSSTFKDLEECRKKVSLVLRQMGHEDVAMEYFVAEDKRPLEKCLDAVASSDLYVGIFAWRYGYIPDGYDKSMTELEYRKAVDNGKNCLIFILHEDALWHPKFVDTDEKSVKLRALKDGLLKEYQVSFFESAEDLGSKVGTAVHNWEKEGIKNSVTNKTTSIDFEKYSKTVSDKYRNLDLDTLTPSKKEDYLKIKLSNVFVEQNVRERMPPVELPKEIWKKIQEKWDPEKKNFPEELSLDEIKIANESYYSKEPKAVLDVITDDRNKQLVILGDPGSGKSTLTRYLLLSILNINGETKLSKKFDDYLPLLIELRKFAAFRSKEKCESFLDYFDYLDKTAIFNLPKAEIEKYYANKGKVLVIFDGLDEVFDPEEWETIVHMIAGFKNRYPKIRLIVTSRLVGYKSNILEDAGFIHFTIQEFEESQIKEFLDRWYSIVLDNKEEIEEKKTRIFRALKDSSSIRELAGNPLLLTILAIVGKHQELPRERWKLYDHAAGVLVEHWDVNRNLKDNRIKIDFIGEEDKKELLMRIAFKMQSNSKGFAGNFIHKKELQNEIENYIQSRFEEKPREARLIATSIINQLRERNFILCHYGADFFGFVHRTFLEYFCAKAIVNKFDNHELNIDSLKRDCYEKYWEDQAWHEVLRLICGMKEKFAGDIIECLLPVYDPQWFGNRPPWNVALALKCLSELRNLNIIAEASKKLLKRVLKLFEMVHWTMDINQFLVDEILPTSRVIGNKWPHRNLVIEQFSKFHIYKNSGFHFIPIGRTEIDFDLNDTWVEFVVGTVLDPKVMCNVIKDKLHCRGPSKFLSVLLLGKFKSKNKKVHLILKDFSVNDVDVDVRRAAFQGLLQGWRNNPETLNIIKDRAQNDTHSSIRIAAIKELARGWHDDPETLTILKKRASNEVYSDVRDIAIQELARGWHDDPETLGIIKNEIMENKDLFYYSKGFAIQELARGWHDDPETLNFIKERISEDNDVYNSPTDSSKGFAIQELARGWHDDPETLRIIKAEATKDNFFCDYTVGIAIQELAYGWHDDPETLRIIKETISKDNSVYSYSGAIAIQELARGWHDDPETLNVIKDRTLNDEFSNVREIAIQELARGWHDDPETFNIIKDRILNYEFNNVDEFSNIRDVAIQELARGWHDDSETLNIVKDIAMKDLDVNVQCTAIQELSRCWHNDPDTLNIIEDKSLNDSEIYARGVAIKELAYGWYNDPKTLNFIMRMALDAKFDVRLSATKELVRNWPDNPETLNIIKDRALNDRNYEVRLCAVDLLLENWFDDPETLFIFKNRALKDRSRNVRLFAILKLADRWYDDSDSLRVIRDRASNDPSNDVRSTASNLMEKISMLYF